MAASSDSPDLSIASTPEAANASEGPDPQLRTESGRPALAPEPEKPSRRSRWLVALLLVALVVAIYSGYSQGQRADQLADEVSLLEGELSRVGAELAAHRAHLVRVRVGVDDLSGRVLALRELAHLDPEAEPSAGASERVGEEPGEGALSEPSFGPESPPGVADF